MKKRFTLIYTLVLFLTLSGRSQTNNIDFELTTPGSYTAANAVNGWTISSQTSTSCNTSTLWTPGSPEFSVVSTPILSFPTIGNIGNSLLGGNTIVRLNNSTANSSVTRIANTFSVNSSLSLLQIAFAGLWQTGTHTCCEQAGFEINLYNSAGNSIPCINPLIVGGGCQNNITYTNSTSNNWTNWQIKYVDLTPYIGTYVTLELSTKDCSVGDHYATNFFDVKLGGNLFGSGLTIPVGQPPPNPVNFCAGSIVASIVGPVGYQTYSWTGPPSSPVSAAQSSLSTLVVNNPIAGSIYTLTTLLNTGCILTSTYALNPSTVGIAGIGSYSTCIGGANGSATVVANGSATGYTYVWFNSANTVVSTSSTAGNLAAGIYSVFVSAAGSQSSSCGTAVSTVTINTNNSALIPYIKTYCGNEAFLSSPVGGSNYQWYNNLTAISATLGGTASSYTVNAPTSGAVYYLRYLSANGCQDSLKFTLFPVSPGTLSTLNNLPACADSANGSAVIQLNPSAGSPLAQNSFSVFSTGTTNIYASALYPTSLNTFSVNGLSAGGTYSVSAFDGSCKYGQNFSVTPVIFNFSLTPASATLCQGGQVLAQIVSGSGMFPGQYSYTWSPSANLIGVNSINALITPTFAPGTAVTTIYSVVVKPNGVNCPLTKTLSITAASLPTPTLTSIPELCSESASYTINTNPPGGTFINGPGSFIDVNNGIISPSLSASGVNYFTYAISMGSCVASSSGSYTINPAPNLLVSGNTSICEGQSTTLLASGADTYSWNTGSQGPVTTVAPQVSTTYTVEGTNVLTTCSNTKSITVSVFANPDITISGNAFLCLNETTLLTASGSNTYVWSTNSSGTAISISPTSSTSYSVVGTSAVANCSNTASFFVSVSPCTSIHDLSAGNRDVKIYPNPSSGYFFVETQSEARVTVFDALGRKIMDEQCEPGLHTFYLNEYAGGIYQLNINSKGLFKTVKLVLDK